MRPTPTLFLLCLILALPTYAQGNLEPPGPPAPTMKSLDQIYDAVSGSGQFEFIGTSTPLAANAGVLSLTKKCQTDFGAGTRLCTSSEILFTVNVPASGSWKSEAGWVRPSWVGMASLSNDDITAMDASGRTSFPGALTCSGYSVDDFALVVARDGFPDGATPIGDGQFRTISCTTADVGVACCAAAPSP